MTSNNLDERDMIIGDKTAAIEAIRKLMIAIGNRENMTTIPKARHILGLRERFSFLSDRIMNADLSAHDVVIALRKCRVELFDLSVIFSLSLDERSTREYCARASYLRSLYKDKHGAAKDNPDPNLPREIVDIAEELSSVRDILSAALVHHERL